MSKQEKYIQFNLRMLNYKSRQDLYERLYLKAIVGSYSRISHTPDTENVIRDRFVWDLENNNDLTKGLIQDGILQLDFERTHFVSIDEKRRTDLVFFISGLGNFTIECKRLFNQNSKNDEYIKNGLVRFTKLKYSKNNNCAGMLGFIVEDKQQQIFDGLRKKVLLYKYVNSKFLEDEFKWGGMSLKSTHKRTDNSKIHIYHLLFDFCK